MTFTLGGASYHPEMVRIYFWALSLVFPALESIFENTEPSKGFPRPDASFKVAKLHHMIIRVVTIGQVRTLAIPSLLFTQGAIDGIIDR